MAILVNDKLSSFSSILILVRFRLSGTLTALAQQPIDDVNPMIGPTGPSVFDYGGMISGIARSFLERIIKRSVSCRVNQ
jgi:hypothetical protein